LPERRATRFLVEALFLVALAAGLTFAHVRPVVVIGVMALGWLLTAIFEWAGVRNEPHFGSGLPPRYYVPRIALPPAVPVERPSDFFPVAESPVEAPTWIVPAGETFDWPWLRESEPESAGAETQVVQIVEAATAVVRVTEPQPVARQPVPRQPAPRRDVVVIASQSDSRRAKHRIDPLAPQTSGRRRKQDEPGVVEVPARPMRRVLPGSARRGED
jgi:hypothetical protein